VPGFSSWEPGEAPALAALVAAALPGEGLSLDELVACCFEQPGRVVLGPPDRTAAVVVQAGATAAVDLLVVHPEHQGQGTGRSLLAAAERWAASRHAERVRLGGGAPFYLWPGVDVHWVEAMALAERAGYEPRGAELNMALPTSFRAPVPPGVVLERVLDEGLAERLATFCAREWPWWTAEVGRGVEQGGCWVARSDDEVVGFACHSVNRAGWLGPMATDPVRRRGGLGAALVGAVCTDLQVAGIGTTEIAWVGPVGFYARLGASVSRVFRTFERRL
jgi:mycothiol synthase